MKYNQNMNRITYNKPELKQRRRKFRQDQTDAEKLLWSKIRNRQLNGLKFLRQYSVGDYVLDFYCPKVRLAVELDGSQHIEDKSQIYDEQRTKFLEQKGIQVVRFWNNEVINNLNGVLEKVVEICAGEQVL